MTLPSFSIALAGAIAVSVASTGFPSTAPAAQRVQGLVAPMWPATSSPPGSPHGEASSARVATPAAIPDIYGPGAVLRAGDVQLKVTNFGVIGNPYTNLSADPSGQWPGPSGIEYLNAILLAVGATNPLETNPSARTRVSSGSEWRPPTLDPVDRIYASHIGAKGGASQINDDGDADPLTGEPKIDEDFLDGRDNDGDGLVDEDFSALGEMMFSCTMRDDTPAAIQAATGEGHIPLGLECRQRAWAYSSPARDFDVIEYTVFNRSGHVLDNLYLGFPADLDAGPIREPYFTDDQDLPFFPSGEFDIPVSRSDPLYEGGCHTLHVRVNGFSVVDGDGDEGRTPGVASLLLLGHTTDPLGLRAPSRVGFTAFRSYQSGTAYASGGIPTTDRERYEFMSSHQNIDPETGFIDEPTRGEEGDYAAWCAIGPFVSVPDGGSVTATIAFAVQKGSYQQILHYPDDYRLYRAGKMRLADLRAKYPALDNALNAELAYQGSYVQPRPGSTPFVPNCDGCETPLRLPPGSTSVSVVEYCKDREENPIKQVTDSTYTWFNFDCDVCTGVRGYYQQHWTEETPPVAPDLNVAATYNYSDHPDRVVAAGDHQVALAWDNLSETTPDPNTGWFDFRTYEVWKVSGWQRPIGVEGPSDNDWILLSQLRLFDHADSNFHHDPLTDTLVCPKVFVPSYQFPAGHPRCAPENASLYPDRIMLADGACRDTATIGVCLRRGDLWDRQTGQVVRADLTLDCVRDGTGRCVQDTGVVLGGEDPEFRTRYPVGRYRFVDHEVKNGFTYFYCVTAGDSTGEGELFSRRSAVEADAVVPQASIRAAGRVWVVPNPYRGFRDISTRPSSWDMTPNATDPTGTHIDFMGLPRGKWRIKIYTTAGDLVADLHSEDAVNASQRRPVLGGDGVTRPGVNRQQDNPEDGEATWNLISRRGQDVASGIYVFVVESSEGQQRGKFVIIR